MNASSTILVVDDHRDIRDLVGRYLQEHGLRVLLADGGDAMKRLLKDHAVDLVVLDIMMPGDDGLTLCRYLREHTELPVILLTAMSEETDRIVGLEMGADDYLTKPFNPRELLAFLEHAGRVLSRDQLMDLTLGREADAFDRSIDNHVSRLRRKMDPDPRHPRLIKTIWGGGYQWIADVEEVPV